MLNAVPKSYPKSKYITKLIIAIIITTEQNILKFYQQSFAIGAFVLLASITNFTISDTVDSFPIFSALYFMKPS